MSDVETGTITRQQIKTPSMYKVIMLNDDFTHQDFVVQVLTQIFNKTEEEAINLMLTIHETGRATIGLYTKEVALTKVMMVDRAAQTYGHPLTAIAEEA